MEETFQSHLVRPPAASSKFSWQQILVYSAVTDCTLQLASLSSLNSLLAQTLPELLVFSFVLLFVLSDICDTYMKTK